MEYIRRCMLVITIALAACTLQAPQSAYASSFVETTIFPTEFLEPPQEPVAESVKSSDESLAKAIADRFKCSLQVAIDAVKYASAFAYKDFPRKHDILAIIAVESRFNPSASHLGSKGVMQVLVKTHHKKIVGEFGLREQIRVGAQILREYHELTGYNSKAAVVAYNIGIGAYLHGRKAPAYLSKFNHELAWMQAQERKAALV